VGRLVPQPPPLFSGSITIEIDDVQSAQLSEYVRLLPWLCEHCRTVQPAERVDCRNCGASKPEDDEGGVLI